jgi:hypothetical protein
MADNLEERGPRDRARVDVNEDWELRYWSHKFDVTPDRLKEVVDQVGPMASDVKHYIERSAPKTDSITRQTG